MGTCETGVLRCFDARHEASMWSEWLYTYMYSVCIREPASGYVSGSVLRDMRQRVQVGTRQRARSRVCTKIRASVWFAATRRYNILV